LRKKPRLSLVVSMPTISTRGRGTRSSMSPNAAAIARPPSALWPPSSQSSLPGGVIMTLTGGFLFGPVVGAIAAMAGALAGASVIFLIARSAAGEWLTRRAGPFAAKRAEGFRADAFSYLLFLRLAPIFPFWLVNLAPALFGVRFSTFIAATGIGILPATVTFAVLGAGLGSVIAVQEVQYDACVAGGRSGCTVDFDLSQVLTPTLLWALGALAILALVPTIAKRFLGRKLDAGVPSKRS